MTGGTSELGSRLVRKLLAAGGKVFFTYHSQENKAGELIREGAKGYLLDLSDCRQIDETVKNLKNEIKSLDILIHNAAAARDKTIQNLTEEDWDYVMAVDLKAPYYLTKQVMSLLFKAASPAKIFFITSRVGVIGGFGISNYAAAKAGLIGLTKSLAQELGKKKILVNAINPGFMKSRMTESIPENVIDANLSVNPLHSWSNPDEVADFMLYLCSNHATQATGQVFHFEGRKI